MAVTEYYLPFDHTVEDPREYSSALWALMQTSTFRGGVIPQVEEELNVTASDPPAMTVEVNRGRAFILGRFYALSGELGETLTLDIPTADVTNPRIDRAVLRLNLAPEVRTITTELLVGTAETNPTSPALTRTATIWEFSLAQIQVDAGTPTIESADITDERGDPDLCGWASSMGAAVNRQGTEIFVQPAAPEYPEDEDIWIDTTDGSIQVWDDTGSAWSAPTYATAADLTSHENDTTDPHSVTKAQVGLGNVDNFKQARSTAGYAIQKNGTDGAGIINFKT